MKKYVSTILCICSLFLAGVVFAAPAAQVVTEARVKEVVTDFVREKTANLGVETAIRRIGPVPELKLPAGAVTFEVQAPRAWEGWGRANLALIVRVNDRVEKNIPVNVEVEALADAVVVVRSLERGDIVGAADVAVRRIDISGLPGKVYRSAEEVIGKRVKAAIRSNTPLKGEHLEKVPLVKSGQLVTIIVESPALRLTATGRSRGNGAEGDIVMVQNLGSLKELPARVIDSGTVQVDF